MINRRYDTVSFAVILPMKDCKYKSQNDCHGPPARPISIGIAVFRST